MCENLSILAISETFLRTSCAAVRLGEVVIKQTLGKFSKEVKTQGNVVYETLTSRVIKESTKTSNIKLILSLPNKEGLSVASEISILYRLEAERKIINAKGERDAQLIIAEGLTSGIIRLKAIEAFRELAKSNNSKTIITDGKTPLIIGEEEKK